MRHTSEADRVRKWKVRKRDGTWWVLDGRGRLRYSCGDHLMALSFALMQGERKLVPYVTFTADDIGKSWNEILKEINNVFKHFEKEDEDE